MSRRRSAADSHEIFLSHASKDRAFAARVAALLRSHQLPVWYSATSIVGARQWHDEIGDALARCGWFVLIRSPHAVRSHWIKHELMYALNKPRYKGRIVPVVKTPCDEDPLSWTLPAYQRVSFVDDFDSGARDLLRDWGIGYRRPFGQPSKP